MDVEVTAAQIQSPSRFSDVMPFNPQVNFWMSCKLQGTWSRREGRATYHLDSLAQSPAPAWNTCPAVLEEACRLPQQCRALLA